MICLTDARKLGPNAYAHHNTGYYNQNYGGYGGNEYYGGHGGNEYYGGHQHHHGSHYPTYNPDNYGKS